MLVVIQEVSFNFSFSLTFSFALWLQYNVLLTRGSLAIAELLYSWASCGGSCGIIYPNQGLRASAAVLAPVGARGLLAPTGAPSEEILPPLAANSSVTNS